MMFTGKERDGESGLDYFHARYYSPAQGRFVAADPDNAGADLANSQTWNGYAYVGNNPLSITDPSGLNFGDFLGGVIHGILNAASGGFWGAFTSIVNGQTPEIGFGGLPGVGGLTGCGGALGSCGGFGGGPWSEATGLGNVQDPGRFVFDFDCAHSLKGCGSSGPPSGFSLGVLWLLGMAPSNIHYRATSNGTREMKRSVVVEDLKQKYIKAGCPASARFESGHSAPWAESRDNLVFGNTTQFQVGGFVETVATNRANGRSTYKITNTLGWSSLLGESTWGPRLGLRSNALDNSLPLGLGRNVDQTFVWSGANPCGK